MPLRTEPFQINLGPQHPSTHGVFRLLLTLDGETVVEADPVMGYLHRGTEKLGEGRLYIQCIPYTDRLDYMSAMSNNLAYVRAVEKLCGIEVPERGQYIRVMMAELARISSHIIAAGTWLQDLGAWGSPLLYMFREREKILDMFEMTCGQRLTHSYMRFGGVSRDIPPDFLPALRRFCADAPKYFDEYAELLLTNEIVQMRSKNVGVLPADIAINASITGPILRACGVPWDLRKDNAYEIYDRLDFDVITRPNGDSFDRFLVRVYEMYESVKILKQCIDQIPDGPYRTEVPWCLRPPVGEAYDHVEAPKGELGFYVVSDGSIAPYRFRIRPPSFINLTVLRDLIVGYKIADAVITFGSLDVVLGEVDR